MSKKGENIYKRKDGRWEARYIKGYSPEGRARYGYCYGRTYHEAKSKASQARAALLHHQPLPGRDRKKRFAACCDEWLQLKRSSIRESTYVKYETIIEKHIKPGLGGCFTDMISELLVEQFSYELLRRERLAPKTVRDILSLLRSILKYTERQFPSMQPVNVIYPRENRKEIRVLSPEEQRCFTEYLLQDMDSCRFGMLLALLTGLRVGEICALRWSDISLSHQTLCVRRSMQRLKNMENVGKPGHAEIPESAGKTECTNEAGSAEGRKTKILISVPKSSTSVRVIPLNGEMTELCRKWKPLNPDAYVLTGEEKRYMEPRALQYRIGRCTKSCGLEGVHFHTLRHSFATRCVEAGFEIKSLSEILGHSSPRITLERYVHSSLDLKRENMDKLTLMG